MDRTLAQTKLPSWRSFNIKLCCPVIRQAEAVLPTHYLYDAYLACTIVYVFCAMAAAIWPSVPMSFLAVLPD